MSDEKWPVAVAAALTFGTGALDVLTLTHLGGVFASVMTGNLALMGLGIARLDTGILTHTAIAVLSYVVGVAVGTRIIGIGREPGALWPRRVTAVLAVQLMVLVGLGAGWVIASADPWGVVQLALLAAAAGSMGMQSAAMRGLGAAVATTYLTGTLTSLIAGWLGRPGPHSDIAGVASLVAAVAGAACGGVALLTVPVAAPLLTLVPLAVVLGTAGRRHRPVGSGEQPE
ncbi:hypothetical protein BH09ACT8_BH09ACT8_49380 [soil metagenome]